MKRNHRKESVLRLSLINSSQDSLSSHNYIKKSWNKSVWGWLRFHLKKKASNWHRPWIDSGQSYLFIRPSVHSIVRSFIHSFIPFVPSLTHPLTRSWFCHACRHTFVRSIMYACIHLCTFLQKSVELPVQRKRFMLIAFFEIQYTVRTSGACERFPII